MTPHVDIPQSFCRGGVARRDVTPPGNIYHRMWGAATHDRATGVHRPLTATVLALAPSGEQLRGAGGGSTQATDNGPQVLVSVDQCLLWNEEMQALEASVCRAARLASEQLHISFTHTHAAGLMDPQRAALPGGDLIAGYLDELARKIGDAAREALASLGPISIVYGSGRSALAAHRDFWDKASGQYVCGFNPDMSADDTLVVARLSDDKGRTIATLVNYACHPTTLAWDNTLVSPDYVGAMRALVETATGAPCIFLQGASGDLGPRHGYVGDTAVAERNGRELGYAALAALEPLPAAGQRFEYTGPVVSGATIGTWDYRPLEAEELCTRHRWQNRMLRVELPYRDDLPTREQTESRLAEWQAHERAAHARGDHEAARDARAHAERMARQLARLRSLPPGKSVPVAVWMLRVGDAFWLALQGEHYNLLQRSLRERFPRTPIVVATVTGGWRPGYVPTAETYGLGIYQESIAIAAPGSLELLIDVIGRELAQWD